MSDEITQEDVQEAEEQIREAVELLRKYHYRNGDTAREEAIRDGAMKMGVKHRAPIDI